jgi:predicted HTH transcriptional regulator
LASACAIRNNPHSLFEDDLAKINSLGRIKYSCVKVLEYMKELPQVTLPLLAKLLGISAPNARSCLATLVIEETATEITGMQRDKIYVYKNYLKVLVDGTNPFS